MKLYNVSAYWSSKYYLHLRIIQLGLMFQNTKIVDVDKHVEL